MEEHFINQYDSKNPQVGYNLKHGGSAGRHSYATKKKISDSLKTKIWSPQALLGRSVAGKLWKGKKRGAHTKEFKDQVSEFMRGWHSENVHPMLGKTHSEESKLKISEASKGHPVSEEHRQALRKAFKMDDGRERAILQAYKDGKTIAEIEAFYQTGRSSIYRILKRNNISRERDHKNWAGRTHSEETKRRMAEARKEYWKSKNQDGEGE